MSIRAVISDFGGVLTLPFAPALARAHAGLGITDDDLRAVFARIVARGEEPALYALERGEITLAAFEAGLSAELESVLGRPVPIDGYAERLMAELHANEPLFAYYRGLRDCGVRMAMLTNNVREYEPLWRAKLPIDEVFEVVVDSAFVGMRKPDPAIYTLTLERLGLPAEACAFVDDAVVNVETARTLGMRGVLFETTEQVVAELDAALAG